MLPVALELGKPNRSKIAGTMENIGHQTPQIMKC